MRNKESGEAATVSCKDNKFISRDNRYWFEAINLPVETETISLISAINLNADVLVWSYLYARTILLWLFHEKQMAIVYR